MRHLDSLEKTRFTERREVRVRLNSQQIRERGELLAETSFELDELECEAKNVARTYRDKMKDLKKVGARYRDAVRFGTEMQTVGCSWYCDWKLGKRYLVRDDTQEEIDVSDIPDDWRQGSIDEPWEE